MGLKPRTPGAPRHPKLLTRSLGVGLRSLQYLNDFQKVILKYVMFMSNKILNN